MDNRTVQSDRDSAQQRYVVVTKPTKPAKARPVKRPATAVPGESARTAYLFLLPAMIAYLLFAVIPIVHTLAISLFDWDGLTAPVFVGVQNFVAILTDPLFQESMVHALQFIPFYTVLPLLIGLLLVVAMTRGRVRGRNVFRTLLF